MADRRPRGLRRTAANAVRTLTAVGWLAVLAALGITLGGTWAALAGI